MKTKHFLVALSILGSLLMVAPNALASTSSVCNDVSCDNPQPASIFNHNPDQPLSRPAPINICETLNNWKVDAVIQVVGGLLKVNWVYTLVPSVVCHLVG